MKVTYPHMGNAYIAINALLRGLKLEIVPPPPITQHTMELGTKYSPEFACLPLKVNVGNFIEAMDMGADTIVMAGGWGPCRFGYYAQVEREILKDLGYHFNLVVLEAPDNRITQLVNQLKGLGQNVGLWEALKAIKFAWRKLNAVEQVERMFEKVLPYTDSKYEAECIYNQALRDIDACDQMSEVNERAEKAVFKLQMLPRHQRMVVRIGLVGEIYTILEPATNYNICRNMGWLDAEVTRSIYLSEWVNDHLLGGLVKKSHHKEVINCAQPYLNYWVGGHGRETVGNAVGFARNNYDGVIQIGPLTCMPEIVAQSILPVITEKEGIPCMTMWFDEHSGQAGINTRLEAFVDMVRRQKLSNAREEA
jgi:predicted nucleotide-binding protein (sugar kinase/HSP70/actin superfamily)